MSIIKKISLKDNLGTDVVYDIGASAENIAYDENTSVKDKLDSLNVRYLDNQLQVWDSTSEKWINKIQVDDLVFYVDSTNGSDENAGTEASPFATITKAISMIGTNAARAATAQIYISNGTYNENVDIIGKNVSLSGVSGGTPDITITGTLTASNFAKVYLNTIKFDLNSRDNASAVVAKDDAFIAVLGGCSIIGNSDDTGFYARDNGTIHVDQSSFNNVKYAFYANSGVIRVFNNPSFITTNTGCIVTNGGIIHLKADISAITGVTTPYNIESAYGGRIFKGTSDNMVGATSTTDGVAGAVPKPFVADRDKFLKGDGTWSTINSFNAEIVAPVENSSTVENSYVKDDQFIYQNRLFTVTASVLPIGGTITPGTNCEESDDLVHQIGNTVSGGANFVGTMDEWNTLPLSEKIKYETVDITPNYYTLTINTDSGVDSVSISPASLDNRYEEGTTVYYTATAKSGYKLINSSGSVVMNNNRTIEISSVLTPYIEFSSDESFVLRAGGSSPRWNGTIEYSIDNGDTWHTWDGSDLSGTATQPIYVRGTGNTKITGGDTTGYGWYFSGKYCTGNIETLLDYQTVINGQHPAMDNYCYGNMFKGSSSLITVPELPATTLANYCYSGMFYNCSSLTTAPELPATTLVEGCYYRMFFGCTSLTTPPELPATTLVKNGYRSMFSGCSSLTTPPELPATTLAQSCYESMFSACSSLTTVPELPATTLESGCYHYMFSGCSSLKLSATQDSTYQYAYRIPTDGTGTTVSGALADMFINTGGTFTGTPTINTTYYTDHQPI